MGQRHVCTFRHAQRAAYRTAISAAQILVYLFISLIHQQSYQTVATKGIRHSDGKARPTGTYSFPDKLSLKTNTYSLQTTTTEKY